MRFVSGQAGWRTAVRRRLGLSPDPRRPSRALFAGIRRRLTIWYTMVIALALILGGVFLYLEVRQNLLGPMNSTLSQQANLAAADWQQNYLAYQQNPFLVSTICPSPGGDGGLEFNLLIACFDKHGQMTGTPAPVWQQALIGPFFGTSLAKSVAGGGSAGDTVTTKQHDEYASIQRFAMPVPNPLRRSSSLGVIQVGLPVGGQGAALATLADLLLLLGVLTVLFSMAAGLFLASRALQPARIAYARQRDFIADASHELRTPLTMLRSTVEFVLRSKDHLRADDVALLEDTVEETAHLTRLANNMLDLARLDSDSLHVEEEVVDLTDIAWDVARWSQPLARQHGVSLVVSGNRPVLVLGDHALLLQAALVLLDNAIKYNQREGSVSISTRSNGDEAVLTVEDTGIGVAPEHLRRLGERFYRVDKARSRESGGAGLGLSIVRSVVARHGGSFDLASRPGEGTTAAIRLPSLSHAAPEEPGDGEGSRSRAAELTAHAQEPVADVRTPAVEI